MRYKIACSISGGVTGSRTSFVKKDGEPQIFETREAAEGEATRYRQSMGRNSCATFRYWVEEIDTDGDEA